MKQVLGDERERKFMAKKEKHNIEVYKSWCKKCGICVAFCPAGVLAQDDSGAPTPKSPTSAPAANCARFAARTLPSM